MLEDWTMRKAKKQRRLCELAYKLFESHAEGTEFLELLTHDLSGHPVFPWQPESMEYFGGPVGHAAWIAGRKATIDVIIELINQYKMRMQSELKEKEGETNE